MKKRKKVTLKRKLFLKAERLAKEICRVRDNNECQLHKYYPNIGLACSGYLQADHGITRACKKYYLDPRNLTWVCGSANRAKCFKEKSVDEAIRQIVINREGKEFWSEMVQHNMCRGAFAEWGQVWWLQEQIDKLEDELADLKVGQDIREDYEPLY